MTRKKIIIISVITVLAIFVGAKLLFKGSDKTTPTDNASPTSQLGYSTYNKMYKASKQPLKTAKSYESTLTSLNLIREKDTKTYPLRTPDDFRSTVVKLRDKVKGLNKPTDIAKSMGYSDKEIEDILNKTKSLTREDSSLLSTYHYTYYFSPTDDSVTVVQTVLNPKFKPTHLTYSFDSTGNLVTPYWFMTDSTNS